MEREKIMDKKTRDITKDELIRARKQRGWTQEKMALYLNTPLPTYIKWERKGSEGNRIPGIIIPALEGDF